jgi:UDP-N-acetyl-D-glucosamine dehydrogenase
VRPILERTGLRCGRDYFLAYSPEREDPGNPRFSAGTIPKVVGGTTPACLELAATLYGAVVPEVVRVQSTQVAEATKQLENIFRAVNVGLVNELKILFQRMGIDIWEVIEAASTKPFGFMSFKPGPGLGGHCLPIDPFYLAWKARQYDLPTRFIELAGEINSSMPGYVVSRVGEALNEHAKCLRGAKILLLGMAYKPNVDDLRESPALKLIELLRQQGADVAYNDPHISRLHKMRHYDLDLASVPLTAETLADSDCVLIVTDHDKYDWDFVVRHAKLIVDTRNATRGVSQGREKIRFA